MPNNEIRNRKYQTRHILLLMETIDPNDRDVASKVLLRRVFSRERERAAKSIPLYRVPRYYWRYIYTSEILPRRNPLSVVFLPCSILRESYRSNSPGRRSTNATVGRSSGQFSLSPCQLALKGTHDRGSRMNQSWGRGVWGSGTVVTHSRCDSDGPVSTTGTVVRPGWSPPEDAGSSASAGYTATLASLPPSSCSFVSLPFFFFFCLPLPLLASLHCLLSSSPPPPPSSSPRLRSLLLYPPVAIYPCFSFLLRDGGIHENGRPACAPSACTCVRGGTRTEAARRRVARARVRVRSVLRARDRRGAPSMCESPAWRCHVAREWKGKNREREVTCECRTCVREREVGGRRRRRKGGVRGRLVRGCNFNRRL